MTTTLRFQDKVAIVTGECKDFGRICVDVLVENGGKVAVFDIDESLSEQHCLFGSMLIADALRLFSRGAAQTVKPEGPGEVVYIHCDMTNEKQIKKSIEETVARFGKLDCLINNAAMQLPARPIDKFSSDDFRDLIDNNLMAYFLACKYALPYIRQTRGSIVNVSSIVNLTGQEDSIIYSATQGGISAMTRALAIDEIKNGVRVNTISPGVINTPMFQEWEKTISDKERENTKDKHSSQGFGDQKEVGRACLFLAVDATFSAADDIYCTESPAAGPNRVHEEGNMSRKHEMEGPEQKALNRSWENVYVVVHGLSLSCYKDQKHARQDPSSRIHHEEAFDLAGAMCELAKDYRKKSNVFRLRLANGAEYLFIAKDQPEMERWMNIIKNMPSKSGTSPT